MPARQDLVKSVWRSVDEEGHVKDSASGELRRAREQCQLAAVRARDAVERAAKAWGSQGGRTAEVQECAGRFCIAANTQFGSAPPGLLLKVYEPSCASVFHIFLNVNSSCKQLPFQPQCHRLEAQEALAMLHALGTSMRLHL